MTTNLDELERLLAEYAEVKKAYGKDVHNHPVKRTLDHAAVNALPDLIKRVREAEKDAARYRLLRNPGNWRRGQDRHDVIHAMFDENLDYIIDCYEQEGIEEQTK